MAVLARVGAVGYTLQQMQGQDNEDGACDLTTTRFTRSYRTLMLISQGLLAILIAVLVAGAFMFSKPSLVIIAVLATIGMTCVCFMTPKLRHLAESDSDLKKTPAANSKHTEANAYKEASLAPLCDQVTSS